MEPRKTVEEWAEIFSSLTEKGEPGVIDMSNIRPQEPAQCVLLQEKWGKSKLYRVQCDCGDDDCSHVVDVEVDDFDISVSIYTNVRTKWWEKSRWKQIWQILTKGYAEHQATIIMKPQTAMNYGNILLQSVVDVEDLKGMNKDG